MSLILEALRKSEAERRRGQAPGLFTPDAAVLMPRQTRGSRWLLASAAVLALLALAAAGWWWSPRGPAKTPVPALSTTGPGPNAEPLPPPATTSATPVATTPPPGPALPITPMATTAPATAVPSTALTATPASARPAPPDRPLPAPARDPAFTPATGSATASSPAPASPSASSTDEPPAVTLAALSSAQRSQLPPLKLSMHVYADEPARRFAIVDGQRITEGSQLGPATVSRIRRDGVLIELDGERYLLPRP